MRFKGTCTNIYFILRLLVERLFTFSTSITKDRVSSQREKNNLLCRIYLFILELINHCLATRLGFSIPKNVFGPGLCIVHYGTIVVSPLAKMGAWCRIHPSTSVGEYNGAPQCGDFVYIGPGAKLYGKITIGNNVAIGANAVVNKSFGSNITIAGIPAKIISNNGAKENNIYPSSTI